MPKQTIRVKFNIIPELIEDLRYSSDMREFFRKVANGEKVDSVDDYLASQALGYLIGFSLEDDSVLLLNSLDREAHCEFIRQFCNKHLEIALEEGFIGGSNALSN